MDHAFAVPLVTARVTRAETYAQIVTALTELEFVSGDLLDGVMARVHETRALLGDLDDRVATANARILEIASSRRATGGSNGFDASEAIDAGKASSPKRPPVVVTAPSRLRAKNQNHLDAIVNLHALPVLHHERRCVHSTRSHDKPKVTRRRTQDEHDAVETELAERRGGGADVLELFRRMQMGTDIKKVEEEEEEDDVSATGQWTESLPVPENRGAIEIDIAQREAGNEEFAMQALINSLETRRAAGVWTT
jgi:hypothetical protein